MKQSKLRTIIKPLKESALFLTMLATLMIAVDWWRGRSLPQIGIPAISYTATNGATVDLGSLSRDNTVIAYFWASWCTPCKLTTPSITKLSESVQVIAIASASDTNHLSVNRQSPTRNIINIDDKDQLISKEWRIQATPTVLFIRNGNIVNHTTGVSSYFGLRFRLWMTQFHSAT